MSAVAPRGFGSSPWSTSVTAWPRRRSSSAAAAPKTPEPMTIADGSRMPRAYGESGESATDVGDRQTRLCRLPRADCAFLHVGTEARQEDDVNMRMTESTLTTNGPAAGEFADL